MSKKKKTSKKRGVKKREKIARRGLMFVLSSPSGAGKTTLTRLLVQKEENIELSISVTSRPRRPTEVEGVHYHFRTREEFEQMRDAGELLEWAEVHGNYYGTPAKPVEKAIEKGRDILFDIDYQGTLQLYENCRDDMVTVFILPPSIGELRARLERRAQDSVGTIEKRLRNARKEMEHYGEYDYVLVNEDLEQSVQMVRSILASARLERARQTKLDAFVGELKAQIDALD